MKIELFPRGTLLTKTLKIERTAAYALVFGFFVYIFARLVMFRQPVDTSMFLIFCLGLLLFITSVRISASIESEEIRETLRRFIAASSAGNADMAKCAEFLARGSEQRIANLTMLGVAVIAALLVFFGFGK